jgi:TrmH family RNA methyltransferase
VLRITSRSNPRLREVARLLASARDRRKAGKCVLEGEHLIGVYAERRGPPEVLVVADDCLGRPGIAALAARFAERTLVVPAPLFAELATLPAGVGILALIAAPRAAPSPPAGFCLLLEDVQDPGNVGSMLRSAAAAGVAQVLLSRGCAFAWSPKVLRAAQGAHFHVELHEDVDLLDWSARFVATGGSLVATVASGGVSLYDAALGGRVALAVGNEGAGLSPALVSMASQRVTIPMPGGTDSLNAAAAAAVCLFECVRQRR